MFEDYREEENNVGELFEQVEKMQIYLPMLSPSVIPY